ncbi:MAG: DUF362 domain-containing protein [candidate division KSB1 bacterium]|jgi:hypothetical protein|nr:DUF362 domain-containing protein [candidate division KSB1 bacterium]
MDVKKYQSIRSMFDMSRRHFLKMSGAVGTGMVLGTPAAWADEAKKAEKSRPETNVEEALNVPKKAHSLPGPFPGRVVEVFNENAILDKSPVAEVTESMFYSGLEGLTGMSSSKSFSLLFDTEDVVGIKVNPVGAGIISTRLEVVDAIIKWLTQNGMQKKNIVIWDRFDYMLRDAGFTSERFPGIRIQGLQTMDEAAAEGKSEDNSKWRTPNGDHISVENFDEEAYYWADVEGPKDEAYLNQHVFNGTKSYFGKLITQTLTKIINVPVFKNTGNGISMATKNLGYGAVCNTGRLHRPLFFNVCTEVLAFPAIRDKLVLNINDALIAQYDGGPMPNAKFTYDYNRLFLATDPFALDMISHRLMVKKRIEMKVRVNEHPMYTEYLRYAEKLGLGIADPEKIEHVLLG